MSAYASSTLALFFEYITNEVSHGFNPVSSGNYLDSRWDFIRKMSGHVIDVN